MSTKQTIRLGLLATAGAASMAFAANAQSARYGGVHQYESGQNCGQACVPAQQGRYATTTTSTLPALPPAPQPVYVDCAAMGTCAPGSAYGQQQYYQPQTVYTQPAQTYTQPSYTQSYGTTQSYGQSYAQAAPVNCPAGTTAQPDGTCMQGGSSSYSSGTTYSTDSYSSGSTSYDSGYSSSYSSQGAPANCPAGTTAQPDGTCMQGGSSSYSGSYSGSSYSSSAPAYSDGSSYGSSSYSTGSSYGSVSAGASMADCPAGTTAQADGTCMQGGAFSQPATAASIYTGSGVDLYQGDASTTGSAPSYGYQADGAYGASDYLPVRK